jgi:hypothetical protein
MLILRAALLSENFLSYIREVQPMKSYLTWILLLLGSTWIMAQGHSESFVVSDARGDQGFAQVEYNVNADLYLVAWEDQRAVGWYDVDIYGQLIKGDGTLIGDNFALCATMGQQYWPRIAVDPVRNLFLVVFEDQRNGPENGDVRGVFIDTEGNFVDAPSSDADHTFGIATNEGHIYTCSAAFNTVDEVYLVVWGDSRNSPEFNYGGVDVYGQLLGPDGTLLPPPEPADPSVNFPIDISDAYEASVADVTYNAITNEFFVVYGTSMGYVLGQRVDHRGQLIDPSGRPVQALGKTAKASIVYPASFVSDLFDNGPDCLQARVASRTETMGNGLSKILGPDHTEVQVVWKGMAQNNPEGNYNDGWGQRIGFFREADVFVTKYVSLNGDTSAAIPSNFPLTLQPDWMDPLDIAYSAIDDEFLAAWGDPRNGGYVAMDLYAQRLGVQEDGRMLFLADDRVNIVTETENIPIDTRENYQGGLLGIAHNPATNEFMCAYMHVSGDTLQGTDILFRLFQGSEPPPVSQVSVEPGPSGFRILGNYPNPFNPSTRITFWLPVQSEVTVAVYDLRGHLVQRLLNASLSTGKHQIQWKGLTDSGEMAPSGTYVIRVSTANQVQSAKMMLVR